MSSLSRELVFLILQFLDEEKFKETVHKLEQESGFFFNMKYFEDEVQNGNWDDVEKYLSGFTKVDDNRYSMKIFFEIRKQKYLEALDKHDRSKAVEILVKDLKVFASFNEELFKEITQLLTLENFRENEQLSKYGDTKSARAIMLVELKKLIEANPLFRDKLQFPNLKNSRLRTLINQSLNWQHQLCKNPRPNPDIKTLFVDHSCGQPNGARAPSPANNPLLGPLPKAGGFPPLGAHGPFQPTPGPVPTPLAGWMSNPPTVSHPSVSGSAIGLGGPSIPGHFSMQVNLPINVMPVSFPGHGSHSQAFNAPDDLPKTVARTLNQGSSPMSMDFHPIQQTLLLVGTNVGDIGLWEVGSRDKLVLRNFKVWDLSACSMPMQAALVKDPGVSVNRIDAHVGGVNDLAFSHPNKQLCVITCGDDKTIKVWDAATGARQYTFEGHDAPVYSVCPHYKENIQVTYLLFSCGTSKDGESHIVEWNESEGAVKRTYLGFRKRSLGVVQFDTTKNRFLAAGDDFSIKYWDMDNTQLLMSVDADGGLPASPRIRFNKDGALLAVSSNENGIKILANSDGLRLLRTFENLSYDAASRTPEAAKPAINTISAAAAAAAAATSGGLAERVASNGDTRNMTDVKPRITEESNDKSKIWKLTEISESSQCRSLKLPENMRVTKISRLIYTNSGNAILALASNAIHLLWKWQRNERNSSGKVSGILMTNDVADMNPEESVSSATFLAFHPQDNNIIAIGMDDSTIQIYNVRVDEICVWSSDGWEKQKAKYLQLPPGRTTAAQSDTRVQFHHDQIHFLVVHETQLAIYETSKLECVKQWVQRESSAPISHATFSCDSQLVYACFADATVCVFTASHLRLRCRINPSVYLSPSVLSNLNVHPMVIAAHPQEPNQFALGLSDGVVHVFEPLESEGKWGVPPPAENGSTSNVAASSPVGGSGSEQGQR
ncbi:CTLH, C-terminal LisH motif-containing protein [Cynara cardunculus var. scolymus]|uniref:CTLH, C-terminal LisH motif-containing protein n=1 Tax=Cynara cardunculus var. scolymus TaxID=59895 RepID=A0A103XWC1_CYNCS|nr:CTLH, C-terminal LisH motif-containing protein [Cynara cardunculus var. scolymus]